MTRETKIGLLVGLAFIIVVAILLSDQVNNANEPPAANADTAGNVRRGLLVPAPSVAAASDRSSTTTIIAPNRSPSQEPIPTPAEAARQTAQAEVHVGPPTLPLRPIGPAPVTEQRDSSIAMRQPATPGQDDTQITPPTDDPRQQAAADGGEKLVPAVSHHAGAVDSDDLAPAAGKQHYSAQAGDSVSKMASRLMGGNTKANRAAIIAANPSLKQNPDRVIVGSVYVIPASASAPAPSAAPSDTPASPAVAEAPASHRQPTRWYVVKPNDNLWRIATDEVGDSSAIGQIISLNKDTLKGGSTIHPNMRLRLPPKTVASAD